MKYKHALFLYPYIESHMTAIMGVFPPTGIEYVATSAKGFADKLTLLDLRYEKELSDFDKLLDFIRKEIDIVCIAIAWDRQFEVICELLNRMPDNIPLVVGGHKATQEVEALFKNCPKIDIIIRGEGEETIREVLKGGPPEDILGISYRKGAEVIHNDNRPIPDVDKVSMLDRSLRRNEYHMTLNGLRITNTTFDAILSARGCPYTCKFCTFSLNPLGQKRPYSARSVESVIKEIEGVKADVVLFSDDHFFVNPKRAEEICDLIIARKIKKRFVTQARIEIARHPRLLEKAVKAGFKIFLMGIESPHDYILEQFNKGFDSDTVRKSFAILKKYPIYYHAYFIYGNLGETEEEMMCIPKFANEIGVDSIGYQKLRIDKYSPLTELARKTPGYHITYRGELYSDTYSHAALKKIGKRIRYTYYTPIRLLLIARKAISTRIITFKEMVSFVFVSPRLFKNVITREIKKGHLKEHLKRIFIGNK